ncbi:unnamed protein product [Prorocentrum cordatum]|uniref:Cytochrome c domain-containing protein n=1 Tax=Prorocentrum cordatum TaxID=2364126 RepID=A0ABN9SW13_9DINO|nr:unnamed protein product [Polarella glacialis]
MPRSACLASTWPGWLVGRQPCSCLRRCCQPTGGWHGELRDRLGECANAQCAHSSFRIRPFWSQSMACRVRPDPRCGARRVHSLQSESRGCCHLVFSSTGRPLAPGGAVRGQLANDKQRPCDTHGQFGSRPLGCSCPRRACSGSRLRASPSAWPVGMAATPRALAALGLALLLGLSVAFVAPTALGAALVAASAGAARAEIEDVAIPVDGKGKTRNLSKEELIRGKRLFNVACGTCHVGGGTRTNQSVGLGIEELSGAFPPRNTIDSLVDYINAPTTYDGLKDISEVHPSIIAADLWPKMRSMKQQDLYDISAYILYQNYVIPEKWGGGKQYY